MHNFKIYSKRGCPYCARIKQVLEAKGQSYTELIVGQDFDREHHYQKFGRGATFPQVLMDGKHLGGCTDAVKYLRENKIIWESW